MSSPPALVLVGRVAGSFGVRGEVRITCYTERPDALLRFKALLNKDGAPALTLLEGRVAKDGLIARTAQITVKAAADAMRGLELYVPRDALPPPDEDEFYLTDLIGLSALTPEGAAIGKVKAVHNFGAGDILEIAPQAGASFYLPFTRETVPELSLAEGRLTVVRPAEVGEPEPNADYLPAHGHAKPAGQESDMSDSVYIGQADTGPQGILLGRANRHGIVAGATGTGKTVTLQVLAEAFSAAGVPVFAADIKGDLSGIAAVGTPNERMLARAQQIGLTLAPKASPAIFWDVFGESGCPIRATISEMGPLLISRLLELSDAQEGVLTIAFQIADDEGLLLLDLDDLQAVLTHLAENAKEIGQKYGNVAPATVGALQRELLRLRQQGAAHFFGEPALNLIDLMRTDISGRGFISVLAADKLVMAPQLYATFLLWLLSELFEQLPEVGDPEKPRLVFFFDEAHLLFKDAPKSLLDKVEQVVRLVRSKGVGIYFVTQNPADIPDGVLAQLGNRIQHALRAYTPKDQEGLKAASRSFRPNPAFDTAEAIQALGVGEALVSTLDEKGAPTMVARTLIRPPDSRVGPLTPAERQQAIAASPVRGQYDQAVNRESAYEKLGARSQATAADLAEKAAEAAAQKAATEAEKARAKAELEAAREAARQERAERASRPRASSRQGMGEALAKSVIRAAGSSMGRQITNALVRGILGSLKR